jgi:hypothetical protein
MKSQARMVGVNLKATRTVLVGYALFEQKKVLPVQRLNLSSTLIISYQHDALEECRVLYLQEWNLRTIIKRHLQTLLRYKNLYWKKRYTVNRIKFGGECTNFFHSMATVSYRKNIITQLIDDSGNTVTDHESKAAILWVCYKNRLGISLQPEMQFNLSRLINVMVDLEGLVTPFLK